VETYGYNACIHASRFKYFTSDNVYDTSAETFLKDYRVKHEKQNNKFNKSQIYRFRLQR